MLILKNTVSEMKTSLCELISKLYTAVENISELEDMSTEMIQIATQREMEEKVGR